MSKVHRLQTSCMLRSGERGKNVEKIGCRNLGGSLLDTPVEFEHPATHRRPRRCHCGVVRILQENHNIQAVRLLLHAGGPGGKKLRPVLWSGGQFSKAWQSYPSVGIGT